MKLQVPRDAKDSRLDRFLVANVPNLSVERARALLADGRVRIRGKACSAARKLWGGEEIELDLPAPAAPPSAAVVEGPVVPVLHADEDVVIVDKPAGLVVEPSGSLPSVAGLLAKRLGGFDVDGVAQPGVVHRLDRETSGCLVLARHDAAVDALKRAFDEKQIEKLYYAIVLGEPPETNRLESAYGRDPKDARRFTTRVKSARRAALSFTVRERLQGAALVEVKLETGRTHQIRVQLAEAGFPVLADSLYGPAATRTHPAAKAIGRHALHAFRLSLPQPRTGERISVEAPIPEDFRRALDLLKPG